MTTKENQHPVNKQGVSGKKPPSAVRKRRLRRETRSAQTGNDVAYTQPPNFNRRRFLLQLGTMVAVVVVLLFVMSLFFKVDNVTVAGVSKYTEWEIMEASGIQQGDNLLTLSKARISSRIYERLPYVKTVRIGRELPGTINIEVVELDVIYTLQTDTDAWWLMRADGVLLEEIAPEDNWKYTKVTGFKIAQPVTGQKAVAAEAEPAGTYPDGTAVPQTTKAEERLTAALSILQSMEKNGVLGEVASVDVSDLWNLQMWYGDRIHVLLGDCTRIEEKISLMATAIHDNLKPYASGELDVTLKGQNGEENSDEVIFIPFK